MEVSQKHSPAESQTGSAVSGNFAVPSGPHEFESLTAKVVRLFSWQYLIYFDEIQININLINIKFIVQCGNGVEKKD